MLQNSFFKIKEITQKEDKNIIVVEINKNHNIFQGHFPGNPVVPGVCLIQMVKECIETLENKKFTLSKASEIKFLNIVNPAVNSTLIIEITKKTITEEEYFYQIVITDQTTIFLKMKINSLKECCHNS